MRASFKSNIGLDLLLTAIAGALCWILALGSRLALVPVNWWRWRDDAVITLSHAHNFVKFGSIGVSPGDRVEGFSSPLQFIVSSIYFFLFKQDYGSFLDLQVVACIGLTGTFTALTAHRLIIANNPRRSNLFVISVSILVCMLAGLLTAISWTTTGWLASGMENPLAMVVGSAIVYFLTLQPRPIIVLSVSVLIALLGITRVEFSAFVLPLSAGIAFHYHKSTPLKTRKYWFIAIVIPLILWGLVVLIRLLYFGDLLPNTALVQDKSSNAGLKISILLILYGAFAVYCCVLSQIQQAKTQAIRLLRFFTIALTASLLFMLSRSSWLEIDDNNLTISYLQGLLAMACIVAIMQYLNARAEIKTSSVNLAFGGLVFIPVAQFVLMGPARLEAPRILSLATPWMAAWIGLLIASFVAVSGTKYLSNLNRVEAFSILIPSAIILGGASLADKPRDMPWIISPSEQRILTASDNLKSRLLQGNSLPFVANPDLGKLSFPKKAIIVDLGWLGDPLLARISKQRNDLESLYLNHVAKPDIVELHGYWSCRYSNWLLSKIYQQDYILVDPSMATTGSASNVDCPLGGRYAIWERKTTDEAFEEYQLTNTIITHAKPVDVIDKAMEKCLAAGTSLFRCSPVTRSIQRSYLRLKQDGLLNKAVESLRLSPSYKLDRELIVRSPGWGKRGYEYFLALASKELATQGKTNGSK
jgi:hypothetical protein